MIILSVADYCRDCPLFEPKCKKYDFTHRVNDAYCITYIHCEHETVCNSIKRHIKDKNGGGRYDV